MKENLWNLQYSKNPGDSAQLVFLHHMVHPGKMKKNNANLNHYLTLTSASHPSILCLSKYFPVCVVVCDPARLYKKNNEPSD